MTLLRESEVVDLPTLSLGFPKSPSPNILRDNLLETFDQLFEEVDIIIVEGKAGIGKTTILAQYAEKYRDTAISLFLSTGNRWGTDPDTILLDYANQANWILEQREIQGDEVDDAILRQIFVKLNKHARRSKKGICIVIDGVSQIPESDSEAFQRIMDELPFGVTGIRFLISVDKAEDVHLISESSVATRKHFPMPFLTRQEATELIGEIDMTDQQRSEIIDTVRGFPESLAVVARMLRSGTDVDDLVHSMPSKLPQLFELEWKQLDSTTRLVQDAIGLMAHSVGAHRLEELSALLGEDSAHILDGLRAVTFIRIDGSGVCEFVSDSFKSFAASKMEHAKTKTIDMLIQRLSNDATSEEALAWLPRYLRENGRSSELVEFLAPQSFHAIAQSGKSWGILNVNAGLGMEAAVEIGRDAEVLRFAHHSSTFQTLQRNQNWKSEIRALAAVGQQDLANIFAHRSPFMEDRIHSLAVVARAISELGESLPQDIIEEIRELYPKMRPVDVREKAEEIAEELLFVAPDLAVDLMTKTMELSGIRAELDTAMTGSAVSSLMDGKSADNETRRRQEEIEIEGVVSSSAMLRFGREARLLFSGYSAKEVLKEVDKFDLAVDKLHFLQIWTEANVGSEDAGLVVQYALDLIVRSSEYAPNVRVLARLAAPLVAIDDIAELASLVGRFEQLFGSLDEVGPSEENIRFRVALASAVDKYDSAASNGALRDAHAFCHEISDSVTKAACLARLMVALLRRRTERRGTEAEFQLTVESELRSTVKRVLIDTGSHFSSTKSVIEATAVHMPEFALELAGSLNTEPRREGGLAFIVMLRLLVNDDELDLEYIREIVDQIRNKELEEHLVANICARIGAMEAAEEPVWNSILKIAEKAGKVESPELRLMALVSILKFTAAHDQIHAFRHQSNLIEGAIRSAIGEIDAIWIRTDSAFQAASELASVRIQFARELIELANQYEGQIPLSGHDGAIAQIGSVRLLVRAFGGLLATQTNELGDYDEVREAIESIPAEVERAGLWSYLAILYNEHRLDSEVLRIVTDEVLPVIRSSRERSSRSASQVMAACAPAIYSASQMTLLSELENLDEDGRDVAVMSIILYLLRGEVPGEPFETVRHQSFEPSPVQMEEIVGLVGRLYRDSYISEAIRIVADSLKPRRGGPKYTRQQQAEFALRLFRVVGEKLPNSRFIAHEGYAICAKAAIARVDVNVIPGGWDSLIAQASAIENRSDRAYILTRLITAMPSRDKRKEIVTADLNTCIAGISSDVERINSLIDWASELSDVDKSQFRRCLWDAMTAAGKVSGESVAALHRQIIDLAYQSDATLAANLASHLDTDPVRKSIHARAARERIRQLELKKRLAESSDRKAAVFQGDGDYPEAAWRLLGALNSGRSQTVSIKNTREALIASANLEFSDFYAVASWSIENACRRHSDKARSGKHIRPIFDAIRSSLDLLSSLSTGVVRSSEVLRRQKETIDRDVFPVYSGQRHQAFQFLEGWISDHVELELTIVDPYFGPDDLAILMTVQKYSPDCRVHVLTSQIHQRNQKLSEPWSEQYKEYWRMLSVQEPPICDIVVVGFEDDKSCPIHDRWWLTNDHGLQIGTSLSSLGRGKDSTISIIKKDEIADFRSRVEGYINGSIREQQHRRIGYLTFSL